MRGIAYRHVQYKDELILIKLGLCIHLLLRVCEKVPKVLACAGYLWIKLRHWYSYHAACL